MKLDFFMLADSARIGEAGKLDIGGACITHVSAPDAPALHDKLTLVARFVVVEADRDKAFELTLRAHGPEGGSIIEASQTVAGRDLYSENWRADEECAHFVLLSLQGFPLTVPGTYAFELLLDREVVGQRSLVFRVVEDTESESKDRARSEPTRG